MAKDYPTEEPENPMVNEPVAEYGVPAKTTYRMISDESRRRMTEKIYKFYHPEV